nr:hypothetical protein [Tanacetum cinerariifolium]
IGIDKRNGLVQSDLVVATQCPPMRLGDSAAGNGSYTVAVPGGLVVEAAAVFGVLVVEVAAVPGGLVAMVRAASTLFFL